MAKKTFEHTIKVTINATDLQSNFYWSLRDRIDDKLMKKFYKTVDWDTILNSTKFNKHVNDCLKADATHYADEICDHYFDEYVDEYYKIKKAYDKFVVENKKKEKTLTQEYRVVLVGTETEIHDTLELLDNSTCAESVDLL
jgi:hypothetical protein